MSLGSRHGFTLAMMLTVQWHFLKMRTALRYWIRRLQQRDEINPLGVQISLAPMSSFPDNFILRGADLFSLRFTCVRTTTHKEVWLNVKCPIDKFLNSYAEFYHHIHSLNPQMRQDHCFYADEFLQLTDKTLRWALAHRKLAASQREAIFRQSDKTWTTLYDITVEFHDIEEQCFYVRLKTGHSCWYTRSPEAIVFEPTLGITDLKKILRASLYLADKSTALKERLSPAFHAMLDDFEIAEDFAS